MTAVSEQETGRRSRLRTAGWVLAPVLAMVLAACGSDDEQLAASGDEPVATDGPASVAALSSDTAEAVRALAGTDRLVAVPASTTNEHLGNYPDEMAQVPNHVPPSGNLDPEQVLSWEPDLVVVTARHDGEQDAGDLLDQSDVPLVTIQNNWGSVEQLQENYEVIAEALGTQEQADELIAGMDADLAEIAAQLDDVDEEPTVLVLTNQAENPFIAGPDSMSTDIVRHAGGTPAVEDAGIERTMPADPEQIIRLDPDAILLVDVMGKGEESFDGLLGNDAVAELPAVEEDRVLMLPGRSAMAAAGVHVVDGVREIAAWLHPDVVTGAAAPDAAEDGAERIAALSGDAAEVLVELVGPERLAVVPESTTTEESGNNPELMRQVPDTIPSVSNIDPEQILAYEPDLVVLTTRHEAEQDARDLLTDSGVPVIAIDNNWETFEQIADNVTMLGEAVEAEERADELVAEFGDRIAEVTAAVADVEDKPVVLVMLSLGADNPYLIGPDSISSGIVRDAGAELAVEQTGITKSMQADPEQVVKADPDAIVLINTGGRGLDDYADLLANEAVAGLDAVVNDEILLLDSTKATATAGLRTVDGLEEVARWLHPGQFGEDN
ncbi:ABC transporter substrate-binding protein [Phytoactinopolyspora mesophila]|uniref:ABC transporter substrate-binding protein n=1 Tax=Phytoactinopolyspora mesophila TaxID=2650750 RepID=A0A7K3M751_9ACTN|nr:ABC transporter substrate-binding protein [Phytoactinopolyspora mesophila]NDL59010.1 ABC transporter substrate-binding protein [Phytoactinopolyspora mesophila]